MLFSYVRQSTERNAEMLAAQWQYLDANTEATGNCKTVGEIVDHVSQQIQPATSLQTFHTAVLPLIITV